MVAVYEDQSGLLWFATRGGLSRFKNGRFFNYTIQDGLLVNQISGILEDTGGNFWFSCAQGIFRVSKAELDDFAERKIGKIVSHAYGVSDGMRSMAFAAGYQPNAWRAKDGRLLFASSKGLVTVDPDNLFSNRLIPPVYIEKVLINNKNQSPGAYVEIPPGEGEVEIHYVALSFLAPEKVRFKYRLEGSDKEWVDAGTRRFAHYAGLRPGQYRFRVIACNNDGVYNETGDSFSFYLRPHFYQARRFYLLSLLVAISLVGAAYVLRIRHLKHKEERLERMVEARTRELAQKTEELESFIYAISHDLKAPVVSLQGLASLLELDLGKLASADATFYLERIHANTDHMQRLINQLLNLSRIGRLKEPRLSINIAELTREAVNDLQGQIELKKASVKIADDLPLLIGERDRLKQVMTNLIANALHYSQPNVPPVIEVGSRDESGEGSYHTVFVRDNGIGIAREHHERIFDIFYRVDGNYADSESTGVGLAIVKRIINSHGGNVWIESEGPGSGSTFCFRLPKESAPRQ